MHGVGQLLVAMFTEYVHNNGRKSIVGFILSPSMVSLGQLFRCVRHTCSCQYLICQQYPKAIHQCA